jgi:hypothetical protein
MTPEQREAELLELLADHKIHEMREVYALDDTCSLLEWYHLAEGLKRRKLVDYIRTTGIIRLLSPR